MDQLPIQLSDASGVPFYRQIVDQIGRMVRAGQLGEGDRLPSVRELSSQLLVSLITTRRAYADLEHAGLIVRRQGHGTFVAEEVAMASQEQVLRDIRTQLATVIGDALRGGLDEAQLMQLFEDALAQGRSHDEQ
jgi:GntR family transcriptional regulator